MVKRLFRYKVAKREGLILQNGDHFGEIAPLPGFSKETLGEAEIEALQWIRENREPRLPSVRFGIDCAKRSLNSVKIPLCSLGQKMGFPTVKLKLGHLTVPEAIDFVKSKKGALRLDCNRKWTLNQAIEFTTYFKSTDFLYMEDPTEDLVAFSKATGFPVAIDGLLPSNWREIPTLKAIVIKPTIVGYIPDVPPHLDLILSSSYESGLGLLHIANLAISSLPIGLDTVPKQDILINPIQCESGLFIWEKSDPILDIKKLCPVH